MKGEMLTIFERSEPGARCVELPKAETAEPVSQKFRRQTELRLPEISESGLLRHYTELKKNTFGVENGFYPLGSCTMKYNPKINEKIASLGCFTDIHPLSDEEDVQGCLKVIFELQSYLCGITGMDAFSLCPAAGSHGEWTGLNIIRAYHESRGETNRKKAIVPDSAHGTNPANAAISGYSVVNIASNSEGMVDLEALEKNLDSNTAVLMLTNPNTLGLFEKDIKKIADMVHKAGALMYYDGANLNAVMGICRPSDMGFDVMHINLHKTFAAPHGGGGPGSGPVGCRDFLSGFLPSPVANKKDGVYFTDTPDKSIGRVTSFYGNFLVALKSYCYILSLGREGLFEASSRAIINANYLKKLIAPLFGKEGGPCMHEFVTSLNGLKEKTGVSALDFAKTLIDYGMHPPTMYFPLIVHEALMIEPTETESRKTLDNAAEVFKKIYDMALNEPEKLHESPAATPVRRPDETQAARNPVLKFEW